MSNGSLFNWSFALGAYALGGPLWAIVAFLGVALVRVTLESQDLRDETEVLRRRLLVLGGPFGLTGDEDFVEEPESTPESGIRAASSTTSDTRAAS